MQAHACRMALNGTVMQDLAYEIALEHSTNARPQRTALKLRLMEGLAYGMALKVALMHLSVGGQST